MESYALVAFTSDSDPGAKDITIVQAREKWFEESMVRAGVRNTMPRRLMRQLLAQTTSPLSIQEIFERSGGVINLVTVYRTVREMERLGLINRIGFGERFSRYEPAPCPVEKEHRHHLVCSRCGRVGNFSGCMVEKMLTDIPELEDFQVERHSLTLYGTCAGCAKQTELSETPV